MEANKVTTSHKPPSDGGMAREEFIRVGTTLYKIVEQPRLSGGYVKSVSLGTMKHFAKTMARTISAAFPSMTDFVPSPNTSAIAL